MKAILRGALVVASLFSAGANAEPPEARFFEVWTEDSAVDRLFSAETRREELERQLASEELDAPLEPEAQPQGSPESWPDEDSIQVLSREELPTRASWWLVKENWALL